MGRAANRTAAVSAVFPRRTVSDAFTVTFGDRRGVTRDGRQVSARADDFDMPPSPEGHRELAAVDMENGWWHVGWYGCDITFALALDDERPAVWQRHYRSFTRETRPLTRGAGAQAHFRLPWPALPDAIKTRIVREIARGVPPRSGSTNTDPLDRF